MSKGNMLLGYARGSVGDMVFQRSKGQQVTKARNREPFNPRTSKQIRQRALFTNAVKFFTRGTQNFFKFAFESKASKESDFNAFMRLNRKNGVLISQEAMLNETYPALGEFILTQGSMMAPILDYTLDDEEGVDAYSIPVPGIINSSSWGEISAKWKRSYNLQEGDLVTILIIKAEGSTSENTPSVLPTDRSSINWSIYQAEISSSDTRSMSEAFNLDEIKTYMSYVSIETLNTTICKGVSITISRNTARGLKVSNTKLIANQTAKTCIENALTPIYEEKVIESWGGNGGSILQGGALESIEIDGVKFYGFRGATIEPSFSGIALTLPGQYAAVKPTGSQFFIKFECDDLTKLDCDRYLQSTLTDGSPYRYLVTRKPEVDGYLGISLTSSQGNGPMVFTYKGVPIFYVLEPVFN